MWVGGKGHTLAVLPQGITQYPFHRRLGVPRAGLELFGKSHLYRDSISVPSSPQIVAIPTELCRLFQMTLKAHRHNSLHDIITAIVFIHLPCLFFRCSVVRTFYLSLLTDTKSPLNSILESIIKAHYALYPQQSLSAETSKKCNSHNKGCSSHSKECNSHNKECSSHNKQCNYHSKECNSHNKECNSHNKQCILQKNVFLKIFL